MPIEVPVKTHENGAQAKAIERLSEDDAAYNATIFQALKDAQAASASWQRHIGLKYGLKTGDGLREDGVIVRGAAEG